VANRLTIAGLTAVAMSMVGAFVFVTDIRSVRRLPWWPASQQGRRCWSCGAAFRWLADALSPGPSPRGVRDAAPRWSRGRLVEDPEGRSHNEPAPLRGIRRPTGRDRAPSASRLSAAVLADLAEGLRLARDEREAHRAGCASARQPGVACRSRRPVAVCGAALLGLAPKVRAATQLADFVGPPDGSVAVFGGGRPLTSRRPESSCGGGGRRDPIWCCGSSPTSPTRVGCGRRSTGIAVSWRRARSGTARSRSAS
jgi:hypothetical protein